MRVSSLLSSARADLANLAVLVTIAGCQGKCTDSSEPVTVTGGRPATDPIAPAITSGVIPRAQGTMKIDGAWDEQDWLTTKCLLIPLRMPDGGLARPYSESRYVHDDTNLYVGLFTSDLNVTSKDAFDLTVGPLKERLYATGKIDPPSSDIRVAPDVDGTFDDTNKDEEWKLEISIPLDRTGLAPGKQVDTRVERCDTIEDAFGKPTDGVVHCNSWSGQLSLQ